MQYNSNATSQDIVTLAEKLTKSNSSSFPIAEKTLYANQALKTIQIWIHDAFGGWLYDDANNTDFPEATTTLTASQVDYSLPTDLDHLKGVSVKDTAGVWNKLEPITLEQILDAGFAESQFMSTASFPVYYRPLGRSIKLYPASNYTQSASLKIYESREASLFTTTDTTKTPGFDTQFHEAVAIFMALQYAKINQLKQKNDLQTDWLLFEQKIKAEYSRRFAEMFPPRIKVQDYLAQNK